MIIFSLLINYCCVLLLCLFVSQIKTSSSASSIASIPGGAACDTVDVKLVLSTFLMRLQCTMDTVSCMYVSVGLSVGEG